jgi:hypothetical protein
VKARLNMTLGLLAVLALAAMWLTAAAQASPGTWWDITAGARPSVLPAGGEGELVASVENLGYKPANAVGGTVVIRDAVPSGLSIVEARAAVPVEDVRTPVACTTSGQVVTCEAEQRLMPYTQVEVRVKVRVAPSASSGESNEVSVTGGEANPDRASNSLTVGGVGPGFGLQSYSLANEEADGEEDLRAGSHPFQQTTALELNQTADPSSVAEAPASEPVQLPKDLDFQWPAGLIGNPTTVPACSADAFLNEPQGGVGPENECPADTAVGVATVTVDEPALLKGTVFTVPLFNLQPESGEPARFGFFIKEAGAPVYIDTSLRTGSDYGVTVESRNITQTAGFLSAKVTVWGDPSSPLHDAQRGWGCLYSSLKLPTIEPCNESEGSEAAPFLSLPSKCGVPLQSTVTGDSWAAPADVATLASYSSSPLIGCGELPFAPELEAQPSTSAASSPAGLRVGVRVPQEDDENPKGLDGSTIRRIAVALPEGVSLNPSAANGLVGCSEAQIGYLPSASQAPSNLEFTSGAPSCPPASRIGTVRVIAPALKGPLEGYLYLADPENSLLAPPGENPFGSLVALYLVAEEPESHVLVKLPGAVTLNESTGQVETVFENTPDVDFEEAAISLFTGERGALVTPARCGSYPVQALFTPWSGTEPVSATAALQVTAGAGGAGCPLGALPFAPTVAAGAGNVQAGAFAAVTTSFERPDGQQALTGVSVQLPPGIAGILSGIPRCGEAQANAGTCDAASLVGEATATAGAGSEPFTVTGGRVYLTAAYEGAPFGLSIVTPAVAGPFDLGNVVVRARLDVNPLTAQVTATTSSPGSAYAIPQILKGIPLQLKAISVTINRPGFTFNPTNCSGSSIAGTTLGAEGGTSTRSVPFAVANCANLAFTPSLSASTTSKASKADGTSLRVKLAPPAQGPGHTPGHEEANIKSVKVELPKQLPSRLTTLQQACLAAQFDANPAGCPAASRVGTAIAHTPILGNPLVGPAYFVSRGGEAFPQLIMVLQGEGITIDLIGDTFISKAGITSSTFKEVPDVPVTSFELTLPQGPYSALTANGDLCQQALSMPTTFTGQNGASIQEATPLEVEGCPIALYVVSHRVSHDGASITVNVPSAGRLTATAAGLGKASAQATRAKQNVTVKLTLTRKERAFLSKHHGRRLQATVKLQFASKRGRKLTKSIRVLIG